MIYSFGEYELDMRRCELRYTGKVIKLEPRVFDECFGETQLPHDLPNIFRALPAGPGPSL